MRYYLFSTFSLLSLFTQAQFEWVNCYGNWNHDYPQCINTLSNGYLVLAGMTPSSQFPPYGHYDYWICKINDNGDLIWQNSYGGTSSDEVQSISETSDGGIIACGSTSSNDGNISGNHGGSDASIFKVNNNGQLQWHRCLGGSLNDSFKKVIETSDGGYIAIGNTLSSNGNVSQNNGNEDIWFVKLSPNGNILNQKCFGGTDLDRCIDAIAQPNGNILIYGYTKSTNGDVTGNHGNNSTDIWLLSVDSNGQVQWKKCFGSSSSELPISIALTNDNGFILLNQLTQNHNLDGDVLCNNRHWILKINELGIIEWQNCINTDHLSKLYSIIESVSGGYIVAGRSIYSNNGLSGIQGEWDASFGVLDNIGNLVDSKLLGGTYKDEVIDVLKTNFNQYIAMGSTESNDGDFIYNNGTFSSSTDAFLTKISSSLFLEPNLYNLIQLFPNPSNGDVIVEFNTTFLGSKYSLLNSVGEKIIENEINSLTEVINLESLNSGMYFLLVNGYSIKFTRL